MSYVIEVLLDAVERAGRLVCEKCSRQLSYPLDKDFRCFACDGFREAYSKAKEATKI